jgi:complement component 1 Q subcomponent-binding protein, mitochondrial
MQTKGFPHWRDQRVTAILLLPLFILFEVYLAILLLMIIVFGYHMYLGISNILEDYVHNQITKNFCLVILRVLTIIICKDLFLFII